jgi:hypothetical protein
MEQVAKRAEPRILHNTMLTKFTVIKRGVFARLQDFSQGGRGRKFAN